VKLPIEGTILNPADPKEISEIDGQGLKVLIESGLTWLRANQQLVNSLNVFPVPDGDTGTNMLLTMQSAYNEVANSGDRNIGQMAKAIAQGALMGARGNSGVILSQLLRGFARALDSLNTMDAALFVSALNESKTTAYKGVVRPVEGTILTVAKDIASSAQKEASSTRDLLTLLEKIVTAADASVANTPELLPILKQAGVVDSGGKGLFIILEGMLRFLKGQPIDSATTLVKPLADMDLSEAMDTVEPGQDYEVVIDFRPDSSFDLTKFYEKLSEIGTSIQVGEGDGMYRMHIHVPDENRYTPIDYTMGFGTITKVAMENLQAQMEDQKKAGAQHLNLHTVQPGQVAVVAVSPGLGISRIFASLGVSAIVEGGQTMNPSTEEIIHAFENLPTDNVIILPNNKNIVLAAQNAATITVKKVVVIPSTSVPQGLSALLNYDPDGDMTQMSERMKASLDEVDTGEITIATRSVEINGVNVEKGQVIALHNGKLVDSSANLDDACMGLLEKIITPEKSHITLFYGENMEKHDVNRIVDKVRDAYPDFEIEEHEGNQPHYQFIISIE